jgi:GT2 family glycosyltransferase
MFSIVIPTCNRPALLCLCLDRIAPGKQTLSSDKYEVIVSDDGKEEAGVQNKYPGVKWVKGPQKGPAANRNNGAKYATGNWIIFLDDDCIPDKDLLENYRTAIDQNKDVKIFEGRIYADMPKYSLGLTSPINLTGGYLWACNFLIQRSFFISLHGFDERFPFAAMEDVDLRVRINKTGNKIIFVSGASVCHPWRKKGGWSKVMQHNISTSLFLQKHPDERKKINAASYFKFITRDFLYETVPGIIKYKGKGLSAALTEHIGYTVMAIKLLFKK